MKSNFYVVNSHTLAPFTILNISKALTPYITSTSISMILFFFACFFQNVFLYIFKEWAREEVEIRFNDFCFYTIIV